MQTVMQLQSLFGPQVQERAGEPESPVDLRAEAALHKLFSQWKPIYTPVFNDKPMATEAGDLAATVNNLEELLNAGQVVQEVSVRGLLVMVRFEDRHYLASGFFNRQTLRDCYHFARFGEKAGFGNAADLMLQVNDAADGVLWKRQ